MAQIIPFPADAEEPELEALSREALLALAQELRESSRSWMPASRRI